jgi:hypothetical protein
MVTQWCGKPGNLPKIGPNKLQLRPACGEEGREQREGSALRPPGSWHKGTGISKLPWDLAWKPEAVLQMAPERAVWYKRLCSVQESCSCVDMSSTLLNKATLLLWKTDRHLPCSLAKMCCELDKLSKEAILETRTRCRAQMCPFSRWSPTL